MFSREWPRREQDEQGKKEKVAYREKRHQEAPTEDESNQRNSKLCSELVTRILRYSVSLLQIESNYGLRY